MPDALRYVSTNSRNGTCLTEKSTEPKEFSLWLQYSLKALFFTPQTPCAKKNCLKTLEFLASISSFILEKVNGYGLTIVRFLYRHGTWKRRFFIWSFNRENGFTAPETLLGQWGVPTVRSYSTLSSKISWKHPGGELETILCWLYLMKRKMQ